MGAVTYAHPKMGGQFYVDVDGTLINANSGTEIKPEKAAEYLRGFHASSEKQAEGAAKQKAAEGYTPEGKPTTGVAKGISQDWKDYGKGDTLVSHDGTEWEVDHAVGPGVYARDKEHPGATTLLKWNEIAKHTPAGNSANSAKREGPGSRGATKWYYDKHGHVAYGDPPKGEPAGKG